jgi:hypothetical protein
VMGNAATVVLRDWQPQRLPEIEQVTASTAEVLPLTLEDIFLAVHT